MLSSCYMRRMIRPVDSPVMCFKLSGNTKLASWYPDNRRSVHNPVSLRTGYHFPEESVISISQCNINESLVVQTFSFGSPGGSNGLGLPTYLSPVPSTSNHHLSHLALRTPIQNSIPMRSFAILATIYAATVGTASGENTVMLVGVQHVCNAKGLSPIPGLNSLTEDLFTSIAKPGLTSTYTRDALDYSGCLCHASHSRQQGREALGKISSQCPRRSACRS